MRSDPFRLVASGAALLLSLAGASCGDAREAAPPQARPDARMLPDLFISARSGIANRQVDALLSGGPGPAADDPNWPTLTYLLGEVHARRAETAQARARFRELALWAAANHPDGPYGDTWGGSGLAIVGLWRWLQILDRLGPESPQEIDQVLRAASALEETRLYAGMVRGGLLPALPLVEEDVARRLARVAWKAKRPEAPSLYLNFLSVDSSGRLDPIDREIQQALIERGLVTPRRLELFRARRQLDLVRTAAQKEQAAQTLKRLWEDREAARDVRAEAGYEWANYRRMQPDRSEVVQVLTSVLALAGDGPIAEQALYRRGAVHNRGRTPQDFAAFRADMLELLRRFPASALADDALFQLATEYLFEPDVDAAAAYFKRLRDFKGANDYQDSAYLLAALGLIGRAQGPDLDAADRLLSEYVERHPEGYFRLNCLFWRGRIAERQGRDEPARVLFQQLVDEAPYDYYGLRAHMHLEAGAAAMGRDLPAADSRTRADLRRAYRASSVETRLAETTVYHRRLQAAVAGGLYRELLAIDRGLAARLDDVALERLDERGLIPAAALLVSLRQDAVAARDSALTADNALRLAGMLGFEARDWPTAIEMTFVRGPAPHRRNSELQHDPRYLATVYPNPDGLEMLAPLARAAWPMDGSRALSQSLMYSVIRHESRFYPRAISQVGALGLFQFMPHVFESLDRRWRLLDRSSAESKVEYLLDPQRNIALWARWVNAEFRVASRDGLALALMKHQAGSGNVRHWEDTWRNLGSPGDLEYRIETARFNATRNFVRRALRDTAIVDAAGFFDAAPGN